MNPFDFTAKKEYAAKLRTYSDEEIRTLYEATQKTLNRAGWIVMIELIEVEYLYRQLKGTPLDADFKV